MRVRPATERDRPFLLEVYANTRTEELSVVPWSELQKRAFLEQQFGAQDAAYRDRYRGGDFLVIEADGRPIGRLYVGRLPDQLRLIDIALLPAERGRGIGSALIRSLINEADAAGVPVTLYVESWNRAYELYRRLGFEAVDGVGVYTFMRRPVGAHARQPDPGSRQPDAGAPS